MAASVRVAAVCRTRGRLFYTKPGTSVTKIAHACGNSSARSARRGGRQAETLSDRQIVGLVENAIRSNPQDFPLLAKYYLDAT